MIDFPKTFLDIGAKGHDVLMGHSFSSAFSKNNKDANAVKLGVKLYKTYGTDLKKSDLEREIYRNRHLLNRYPRYDLVEKSHTVKKGETVFTIALKNNVPVEELIKANPKLRIFDLIEGQVIDLPSPDDIKQLTLAEYEKIINSYAYLFGNGEEHDLLVEKMKAHFNAVDENKTFTEKIIEVLSESVNTPTNTPYYVWETQQDERVRDEHANRQGDVFKWSNPPAGGNPGSDYGCRCNARAFNEENYTAESKRHFDYDNQTSIEQSDIKTGEDDDPADDEF